MTPKEKAIDLVEDMHDAPEMGYNEHAKQCALIAVDEIIKSKPHEWDGCDYYSMEDYWKQVLVEINKL
jgi:hypothetical protein